MDLESNINMRLFALTFNVFIAVKVIFAIL